MQESEKKYIYIYIKTGYKKTNRVKRTPLTVVNRRLRWIHLTFSGVTLLEPSMNNSQRSSLDSFFECAME